MTFLEWLEQSALALWVGESLYGYPFLLGMHAVGLAIIVGLSVVVNLHLVGLFEGVTTEAMQSMLRIAWVGFAVNAVSGLALFTSQATFFVTSTPFLTKIACIACGLTSVALVQRDLRTSRVGTLLVPVAGMLSWLGAIVAGRLIAYL